MRSGEESQWWCPPATHNCRFAVPQQPLEAHVQRWHQVRLHHKTVRQTRTPGLQLHKLPQVRINDITMKCNQSNMIKILWLPVNTEQKLLQYLQIPISHAILTESFFNIYSRAQGWQNGCNFKMQILYKSCQAMKIQYQYSKIY